MNKIHTNNKSKSSIAPLKRTCVLQVKGADALSFLQGQMSQDLRKLTQGSAIFSGLSNPKGRLLAVCHVYRSEEDEYLLILPESVIDSVRSHLTKYVMRSKVSITKLDELYIYGVWNGDKITAEHQFKLAEHCDLLIGISSRPEANTEFSTEETWNQQKVLHGIPEVFSETQEHFVAQMLNLDLLNGISFNKGCYTGQEIIARMQNLGRIKRRMLLIELEEKIGIGGKFTYDEMSLGEIVNITNANQKLYALVCIQLDKLKQITETAKIKIIEMGYSVPEMNES